MTNFNERSNMPFVKPGAADGVTPLANEIRVEPLRREMSGEYCRARQRCQARERHEGVVDVGSHGVRQLAGFMLTLYAFPAMTTHQGLGEFEQLVLLAIVHLRGDAYGIPIVDEIERRTGRRVARAAVYVTLRRLEEKGYVSSWIGDPTPERGGKGRRYVKIELAGRRALRESRQLVDRMWGELDPASLRSR
jgi:DNA-binding PadR family transcriptional regulator